MKVFSFPLKINFIASRELIVRSSKWLQRGQRSQVIRTVPDNGNLSNKGLVLSLSFREVLVADVQTKMQGDILSQDVQLLLWK